MLVHQLGKGGPSCPEQKRRENGNKDDGWLSESTGSDEGIEREDVDDNRSQHEKSDVPGLGNRDENASEDFEHLHEGQVARSVHRAHEGCGRGAFSRRWHRYEMEEEIESEDNE